MDAKAPVCKRREALGGGLVLPTPKGALLDHPLLKPTGSVVFLTIFSFLWGLAASSESNLNKVPIWVPSREPIHRFLFSLEDLNTIEPSLVRQ